MSAAPKFAADPRRRAMLGKIHVAKKQLKLSQENYEAVILRLTGGATASAGDLTEKQMDALLAEFERLGFRPLVARKGHGTRSSQRPADHPSAKKARAMWISLWNLGAVESATEASLEAFARRQLGVAQLQWADQAKAYKLIEALKAMAERAGWKQGAEEGCAPPDPNQLLIRLIERQVAILQAAGDTRWHKDIVSEAAGTRIYAWNMLPDGRLRQIAAALGERVRAVKAG